MLEESVSSSAPTFWAGLYSWFTPTVFFVVLQLVIGTIYITSTLTNKLTHKHHNQHQEHRQDPQDFQHPQLARSPSVLQRLKSINFYSSIPYRSQDPPHQIHEQQQQQPQLLRSPSLLQRFKSINLYSYIPTEPFTSMLTTTDTNVVSNTATTTTHYGGITYEPEKQQQQQQHVYDTAVVETDDEENEDDEDDDVVGKIQHNLKGYEEGGADSSMDEIYDKLLQGQDGHFIRTQSDTKPSSGEVPVKLPRKMKKSASSKSAFSHFKEDDIVESRRPATVREKKVSTAAAADDDEVDAKADDFINKFKQQLKLQRLDSIMRYKEMIGRGS